MRIVSTTKRPFHEANRKGAAKKESSPSYNFFTFTGSILDGTTFEPVTDATVTLKMDGKPAEMFDASWPNPFKTVKSTKGVYSFWVKPVPAEKAGIAKNFPLSIEVKAEGYNDLVYHFEVPIMSEDSVRNELDSTYTLKINDLVIFKRNIF